jgi:hypothetical protein
MREATGGTVEGTLEFSGIRARVSGSGEIDVAQHVDQGYSEPG